MHKPSMWLFVITVKDPEGSGIKTAERKQCQKSKEMLKVEQFDFSYTKKWQLPKRAP